jgi:hypothetical protein
MGRVLLKRESDYSKRFEGRNTEMTNASTVKATSSKSGGI